MSTDDELRNCRQGKTRMKKRLAALERVMEVARAYAALELRAYPAVIGSKVPMRITFEEPISGESVFSIIAEADIRARHDARAKLQDALAGLQNPDKDEPATSDDR